MVDGSAIVSALPSVSITASSEPTGTFSPSAPWMEITLPDTGAGISTTVLSVDTSTSGWSSSMESPAATCQWVISASAMPSPTSASLNT